MCGCIVRNEMTVMEDEILKFVKQAFLKMETSFSTTRAMVRGFIQSLDVKKENPDKDLRDILAAYKFAVDEEQTYEDYD